MIPDTTWLAHTTIPPPRLLSQKSHGITLASTMLLFSSLRRMAHCANMMCNPTRTSHVRPSISSKKLSPLLPNPAPEGPVHQAYMAHRRAHRVTHTSFPHREPPKLPKASDRLSTVRRTTVPQLQSHFALAREIMAGQISPCIA